MRLQNSQIQLSALITSCFIMKYLVPTLAVLVLSVLLVKTVIPWFGKSQSARPAITYPWFRLSSLWSHGQMDSLRRLVKRQVFKQVTEAGLQNNQGGAQWKTWVINTGKCSICDPVN